MGLFYLCLCSNSPSELQPHSKEKFVGVCPIAIYVIPFISKGRNPLRMKCQSSSSHLFPYTVSLEAYHCLNPLKSQFHTLCIGSRSWADAVNTAQTDIIDKIKILIAFISVSNSFLWTFSRICRSISGRYRRDVQSDLQSDCIE